jgi:hypothetical protein
MSRSGDVVVALFDPAGRSVTTHTIHAALEVDDHDHPAFTVLPDGRILAFYAKHGKDSMFVTATVRPGDIEAWEEPRMLRLNDEKLAARFGHDRYTYVNPWRLEGEANRIYLFWRGAGYKPNVSWSDDAGVTWTPSRMVICPRPFDGTQRPYVKYFSDGSDRIHLLFTDGHPRNEPHNSVYYACYRAGAFWRADGTRICRMDDLPFEPKAASIVYDGHSGGGRAWVWDVCADSQDRPVAVYVRCPTEADHRYHYTRWDGSGWRDMELAQAGPSFPMTPEGQDEREPHYSAGLTLDPAHPDTVYLAVQTAGRFEIEARQTEDGGLTWRREAITRGSQYDNVRPYVARWAPPQSGAVLLWMRNENYVHYTDFRSAIVARTIAGPFDRHP